MGPVCTFQAVALRIALSSAAAVAARRHVDNRMMYTRRPGQKAELVGISNHYRHPPVVFGKKYLSRPGVKKILMITDFRERTN
ncbi:MAG: hypothetical protein HKP41_12155 [Desulfobacterales bacterium]|nr:hypothetical protein [Deltaproteobacteria bacterium]NNK95094.1 hypothetical protein [Desulfobacterales bacterium]